MNQVNLVLKNKIHQLVNGFLQADTNSVGYVSYEKFVENVNRLGINQHIVSDQDIRFLFNKFKRDDQHTINYKAFIDSLKNFRFSYEEMYTEFNSTKKKKPEHLPEEIEGFHIVDCRNLPYNRLLDYWGKTQRVNDAIKRYFPNKTDLNDYLSKTLQVDKDQVDKVYMNQQEMKNLVDSLFKNFDTSYLMNSDFEGFLSSFIYNRHGYTNLKEFCRTVYEYIVLLNFILF